MTDKNEPIDLRAMVLKAITESPEAKLLADAIDADFYRLLVDLSDAARRLK